MKKIEEIKIRDLERDLNFDEEINEELWTGEEGLIFVKKNFLGYEVISGKKRIQALKEQGQETVSAIVVDDDDYQTALINGIQKEKLSPIEEAVAIQKILADKKMSQQQLAVSLGYKQSTIANKLRLLKLPPFVQDAIATNKLSERHGRALLKLEYAKQEEVARVIIERKYTVSQSEEYIEQLEGDGHKKAIPGPVKMGLNTIKKAYDLCKDSGMDVSYQDIEYAKEVKIIIRFKK